MRKAAGMTAEPTEIERALALGASHAVGSYRYDLVTQRWWWSDETFQIHGFKPGQVVPTTTLVLAHKHPDDRVRVAGVLRDAVLTGEPFSSVHRIKDARGRERTLTVVGQGQFDPGLQRFSELAGYFIDVTSAIKARAGEAANASIRAAAVTRAPIEQAKGIIAFTLGIDAEAAFERLRAAFNLTNVPVRDLARRVAEMAGTGSCSVADVAATLEPPRQ